MTSILRVLGSTPSSEILCPRQVTSFRKSSHLSGCNFRLSPQSPEYITQFPVVIDQGICIDHNIVQENETTRAG